MLGDNIVNLCLLSACYGNTFLAGARGDTEGRCASSLFLGNAGPGGVAESSHASRLFLGNAIYWWKRRWCANTVKCQEHHLPRT